MNKENEIYIDKGMWECYNEKDNIKRSVWLMNTKKQLHSLQMRFPNGLGKAVTLSYDDGDTEDIRLVEILDRHGLKCTFNLNSGLFSQNGEASRPERKWGQKMTRDQATKLYKNTVHEIAVHGYTHPYLDQLTLGQAAYEIVKDRETLEEQFDTVVRGMAYPYGRYSDEIVEMLRGCGIVYARTCVSTLKFDIPTDWLRMPATCHHANPALNSLVDTFLSKEMTNSRPPMLFYLWGHGFELERDNNWEIIENFAERMGGRDDIWYATNIEIYEYVEAFHSLVFSADSRIVRNPTATTVWFCFGKELYKIEPNETLRFW